MSDNALVQQSDQASEIERVLVQGDIGRMPPEMRLEYYRNICVSLGLNPLTKPFEYLTLQGKTILYAKKDATDQLRKIHGVSINIVSRETIDGVYVVTARATDDKGRQDESLGALPLPASPVERANAIMKCETKAKRRVTLSICGLGMLDETEIETIPAGSKEQQKEYLASKGLTPYKRPAQAKIENAYSEGYQDAKEDTVGVAPTTIRELADELDKPPQGIKTIEMRHASKVAEADAQLKEVAKKPPRKRGGITFDVLKYFGEIKTLLRETTGDDLVYYQTLKASGYDHADAIKDNDQAREIYRALGQLHKRATEDKKLRIELELAKEHFGDRFMQVLGWAGCESVDDALNLASEPLEELRRAIKELPPMP